MRAFQTVRLLTDALKDAPRAWVKIAYPGRFLGHAAGPFEMTARTFDEIVSNFKTRGKPVVVDINHSSENPATNCTVEGASAKGWFHDLERRGTDLWGELEAKPPALAAIRDGSLPFLSPAVKFGCKDPETGRAIGARLSSVALCTNPFLFRQAPLQMSEGAGDAAEELVDYAAQLREALDLPEDAPGALMRDALDRVDLMLTDAGAGDQARAAGVDPSALESRVRAAAGVDPSTGWAELVDMLRSMTDEMKEAPPPAPETEAPAAPETAAEPAPAAAEMTDATPAPAADPRVAELEAKLEGLGAELRAMTDRATAAETRATEAETARDDATANLKTMTDRLDREAKTVVMRDLERGVVGFTKSDAPRLIKMWSEEPEVYAKTTARRQLPAYLTQPITATSRRAAESPPPPAPPPTVRQMTDSFMGEGMTYEQAFTAATSAALGLRSAPKGK